MDRVIIDLVKEDAEPIGIGIVVAASALVINTVLGALGFAPLAAIDFNITPQGIAGFAAASWGIGKAAQWAPGWVKNALKAVAR